MADNSYCKDCRHYSVTLSHCAFGFPEFKSDEPTKCDAYSNLAEFLGMGKNREKDILCYGCMNMIPNEKHNKSYCTKEQVFFNTKKAQGCREYNPIVKKSVILLPEKFVPPVNVIPTDEVKPVFFHRKPKYRVIETDDYCYHLVD